MMTPKQLKRFCKKVLIDETSGCWVWIASKSRGYGMLTLAGTAMPAHRAAYEHWAGPIPIGLTIDHLCRIRACVNPAHMECVTLTENIARGEGPSAKGARRTHCNHGHALVGENLYMQRNSKGRLFRRCRTCVIFRARANRDRINPTRQRKLGFMRDSHRLNVAQNTPSVVLGETKKA